ncbi:hypothetical protein WN51_07604 [Melipona quadrifasciata]|uniref:Uncharacterized protein n=1 Tax=Melipona quadrifasciata TaxID=166423 RepID=A0A0M8ZP10_9HYME|nr:hypothetical protein WN51_07604 [Melipona quadrifasciata]
MIIHKAVETLNLHLVAEHVVTLYWMVRSTKFLVKSIKFQLEYLVINYIEFPTINNIQSLMKERLEEKKIKSSTYSKSFNPSFLMSPTKIPLKIPSSYPNEASFVDLKELHKRKIKFSKMENGPMRILALFQGSRTNKENMHLKITGIVRRNL